MIQWGKPAPDLAQQIDKCLFVPGSGGNGKKFYEFLPDSGMSLALRFSATTHRLILLGPATRTYYAEVDAASSYLCLRFRPGQAPRLADVHPTELIDSYVELDQIQGKSADALADRLHLLPDLASRQRLMEDLVRKSRPLLRDKRCRQAAALLEAHGGNLQVHELADQLGLHVRSLERLFLEQLGLPPKRLTRLIRLRHLVSRLRAGHFGSMADLACACGYADQSHMIKEFKELTGRLPGQTGACKVRQLSGEPPVRVINRR